MIGIAQRVEGTCPTLAFLKGWDYLTRAVKPPLLAAINEERLTVPIQDLARHVRITQPVGTSFELVGGRRNFARSPDLVDLRMRDGGWITFSASLRMVDGGLKIEAYNFERVFSTSHNPPFVRFDLNPTGHDNDLRHIRSHLHPGNDDIQLPAPIFAPHELLELLLADFATLGKRALRTKGK